MRVDDPLDIGDCTVRRNGAPREQGATKNRPAYDGSAGCRQLLLGLLPGLLSGLLSGLFLFVCLVLFFFLDAFESCGFCLLGGGECGEGECGVFGSCGGAGGGGFDRGCPVRDGRCLGCGLLAGRGELIAGVGVECGLEEYGFESRTDLGGDVFLS